MYKNHRKKFSAIVKIRKVLIFLYKNLIVKDDFNFLETFDNIIALFLSKSPIRNKIITVFKKG